MKCNKCEKVIPVDALFCPYCGKRLTPAPRTIRRRGNGQGTAFKHNGSWTAQVTLYQYVDEDGKTKRKYKTKGGFSTKKAALEYIPILYNQRDDAAPMRLTLWERYSKASLPSLSYNKRLAYRIARKRLEPVIHLPIDKLTLADIEPIIESVNDQYYSARDIKVLLSHLYNLAIPDGYVTVNLASYIKLPEHTAKESVPFTQNEITKMWESYGKGNKNIGYALIMIYSGMMPAELLACYADMIDMDKCEIYGCGKKTKKRKAETPIVFAEAIKPVIADLISDRDKLYPFSTPKKFYDDYYAAIREAGVRELPPYSCRHTTGTEAARLGLSAPIIQEIMRHARISTSQQYIHLGADSAHRGINQIQ
ncbi:MAG: tyrosine-type recombinase/integrase [Ruminococcus sp.]|nr:tyrosine-type recombinase/integrase [Ruminococcus sp.]